MSKIDEPASVWWSVTEPKPMSNTRQFWTLSEAIRYVRRLPQGSQRQATVHTGRKQYGPREFERLEKEMRQLTWRPLFT